MSVITQAPPAETRPDPVGPAGTGGSLRRAWASRRLSRPLAVVLLLVLVAYPLGIIVVGAFINGTPVPGAGADWTPTLEHVTGLAESHGTAGALWNSLSLSALSTVLGVASGALIAWLAARTDVPMPRLVAFSGVVPMLVPGLIGAIGWTFLASPDVGYIPMALRALGIDSGINIYSYPGMLFVYTLYNVSLAFIFVYGALQLTNPEMEDAATVHGATRSRAMLSVTMPLAKPAILSAVLLTFVSTMEDFPVAMILGYTNGIETLAARIFVMSGSAPPPVNANSAQSVLLMVVVLVLVSYQRRLLRGQSFATVTGKGVRHRKVQLGWARWFAFALVLLYLFLSVGLPFAALLLGALRPTLYAQDLADLLDPAKLTVEPLQNALQNPTLWTVAKNSFVIALLVALLGVLFSLFLAHTMRARDGWASRMIRRLSMLPAAAPGVVLGLGMLWAYVSLRSRSTAPSRSSSWPSSCGCSRSA